MKLQRRELLTVWRVTWIRLWCSVGLGVAVLLGFVALNADGNGLRVVGFVAFRHDIGLVCCRLYRVLAFFRTGREPVDSYRRRCAGSERGSVDQAEHGFAIEQELSLRRGCTGLALILNRSRERDLVALACLIIARGESRHDQVRRRWRRFRLDFDRRDIRAVGSGVVLPRQGGEVIAGIIVGVLDRRRRLRYIGRSVTEAEGVGNYRAIGITGTRAAKGDGKWRKALRRRGRQTRDRWPVNITKGIAYERVGAVAGDIARVVLRFLAGIGPREICAHINCAKRCVRYIFGRTAVN